MISNQEKEFFKELYQGFEMPLSEWDCGKKCGPHNDYGVPVCCDIKLVVPAAFEGEWGYLEENTDLWKPWSSSGLADQDLEQGLQNGQVLLQCQGYRACQRSFRTLTCRAFPFYPYLSSTGDFLGLAYYHEFRPTCWIISNLPVVKLEYKRAFRKTFEKVFQQFPGSRIDYQDYCSYVREEAAMRNEQIVILDFSAGVWLVDPETEKKVAGDMRALDAYGPYLVTRELRFPDEIQAGEDDTG